MARTHAECLRMIEGCRAAGVGLYVAYYRRCLPLFLKVRELINDGAIGSVRFVAIQLVHAVHPGDELQPWRVQPEIAGGGHFYDLASHQLDYLDYIFGPVTAASGQAANQARLYPAEDAVTASWRHETGVLGSGVWCFTAAPGRSTDLTEITGSQGRLTFSYFSEQPLRLETARGVEEFTFPRQDPIQQPLIQRVVDALRGVGESPSTGESGARTNAVLEQIVAGYY